MTTLMQLFRSAVIQLQALSKSRQEPAWLTELRLEALDLAGTLDLPKLEKTRIDRWNIDSYGEYKEISKVAIAG